jgi:hypothetical protein
MCDQLQEIDRLIERAERRATALRNQLSYDAADDLTAVSQFSDALDKILQLKLSRDMLAQFVTFDRGVTRKKTLLH